MDIISSKKGILFASPKSSPKERTLRALFKNHIFTTRSPDGDWDGKGRVRRMDAGFNTGYMLVTVKKFNAAKYFIFVLLGLMGIFVNPTKAQSTKVIIGYVGGYKGLVKTELIKAKQLTHINYAFVDIRNNRAWLHREATDTINFSI